MPGFSIPFEEACHDENAFSPDGEVFVGQSNLTETARVHRYRLEVLDPLGAQNQGILLFAYKITRPAPEIDEVTIHSGQDEIYRPGKNRWKPIEIKFYEKLTPQEPPFRNQAAELIYQWWAFTMIRLEDSLHNSPATYLRDCQIDMTDGVGNSIWTYQLMDSWPVSVSPADLSYAETDIADITVKLRYSKCREMFSQQGGGPNN